MPTDLRPTTGPPHSFEVVSPNYEQRKGITRLTVNISSSRSEQSHSSVSRPAPRWTTPEFLFYGVTFALVVPMMVWLPARLSNRTCYL